MIYPRRVDLATLKFWSCAPCRAYVGCHKAGAHMFINGKKVVSDGTTPLGRLADADLRTAKQKAHAAFDPLWTHDENRSKARKREYKWLANALGINPDDCHIGEFDLDQCFKVELACDGRSLSTLETRK